MEKIINISKRMISMILITVLAINFTQAQPGGQQGPPPIPNDSQVKKMVADLTKELSLNATQEKNISSLYFAHFKEAKMLAAKKASREEMQRSKTTFEKNVKSLLTADQQKKFNAFQKKNQQQGGKPRR